MLDKVLQGLGASFVSLALVRIADMYWPPAPSWISVSFLIASAVVVLVIQDRLRQ